MSIKDYIKEKWYMFGIIIISSVFVSSICLLDRKLITENKNVIYILAGIVLFLLVYVIIDFIIIKSRVKNLSVFIKNGGTTNETYDYPADKIYSNEISELANEFNKYRAKIASDSADELDFVTKWVHDVKVPISAMKLLLENDAEDSKERLEMELLSIEQNTQKVLFHIKSSSFYDDYKITIMIKNTGQGIKSSEIKQIFNKGYTSNNRNGLSSTGYGLYLSKKLADKLGHNITAESKYCKYASFSLIFINNENNIHVTKM